MKQSYTDIRLTHGIFTRFLLFVAALLMTFLASAQDFNYTYEGQTLTYTVIDETAKTCMTKAGTIGNPGNKVTGVLHLPKSAKNDSDIEYTVVAIGESGFYNCTGLTGSLTIPESVTLIGKQAFQQL